MNGHGPLNELASQHGSYLTKEKIPNNI